MLFKKSEKKEYDFDYIAVPSMNQSEESMVSNSFGKAPFIIIYDVKNKNYEYLENLGFQVQDGSGLKAAELIIKHKAKILITREIGRKAYSIFMKEHINIHLLKSNISVKSAINQILKSQKIKIVS